MILYYNVSIINKQPTIIQKGTITMRKQYRNEDLGVKAVIITEKVIQCSYPHIGEESYTARVMIGEKFERIAEVDNLETEEEAIDFAETWEDKLMNNNFKFEWDGWDFWKAGKAANNA